MSHTFADDGIFTADLIVTDDEGTADQATKQITINNVAPTVILSGDATFDEGDFEIYDAIVSDPGDDGFTVDVADVDCGTGGVLAINTSNLGGNTIQLTGTGFRFACVFPDGPACPTVQAQVQDTDGAPSNLASLAVTVNNVAPDIIIFDGPTTANEGETIPYSFEFFDQGDDIVSFAAGFPDCGAGGTLGSVLLDIFVGEFECAFPDGPASPTVRVQLTDSDGANSTIESLQVNVSNVRPSVSLVSPDTDADEGDTNTYDFTVADPGDDTFTVLSGFPGCGSSGDLVNASLTTDPNGGSFQCSFPDGPGSSTVAIQVTDSDQQDSIQSTATVNVSNVAPNLTISGVPNVDEGSSYTLNLASSDPGDDTIQSWTTNWNDGSAPQLVVGSPPSVTHVFPGDFDTPTITADATDEDGTFSSNTHTITVNNLDPIINSVTAVDQQLPAAGGTSTISVDATDPGPGDIPGLLFSFDCDNDPTTGIDGFEVVPQQANSAICTFDAADRGANTVNVKVEDPDGGFALADTVVIVGAAVNLVLLPSTATPEVGTTGSLTLRVITNSTPVDSVDAVFSFFGSRLSFAGVVENTSGLPNVLCSTVLPPEGNADVTIRCTASGTTPVTADFDMAVITYNADNIGPASVEFDPDPARTGAESGGVPVLERAALPAGGATVSVQGFVDVELTVSLQAVPRAGDNVRFEVALLDSGALNPSIANTPWLVFSQATPIHTFTIPVAEPAVSQTFTLVLPQVRTAVYDITVVARRDNGPRETLVNLKDDVNVNLRRNELGAISMATLLDGNAVNDPRGPSVEPSSIINALDVSVLVAAFGTSEAVPEATVQGDLKFFDSRADRPGRRR